MKLDSNTVVHVWKWWWPVSAGVAVVEADISSSTSPGRQQAPGVCELSKGCVSPGIQLSAAPPGWTNELARVTSKVCPRFILPNHLQPIPVYGC